MKNTLMLPHRYKTFGLLLLIPALVLGIGVLFFSWQWSFLDVNLPKWFPWVSSELFNPITNNLTDEITLSLAMIALLILCFSSEKVEDEFIRHTRLQSLQWAVLIHYIITLAATWLIYNEGFWYVMLLGMLTIPVIFLARFHWILYRNQLREDGI
jgi:hypothetical protein